MENNQENGRLAILDMDSIAFAIGWGNKIPDGYGDYLRDEKGRLIYEDKTPDELALSADQILIDILTNCEATHYIGYIKGSNTGKHRYAVKSDYKYKRPKESPKWWNFVKDYLINKWQIHEVNDIEVDDAVNITYRKFETGKNTLVAMRVAIDKDLLHLSGYNYDWRNKQGSIVTLEGAAHYFWKDMIVGQPGDGITGIPGKGEAYWKKYILADIFNTYGEIKSDKFSGVVLEEYIKYYGESKGIEEFYKNYNCLKILEEYEGFVIPDPEGFYIC